MAKPREGTAVRPSASLAAWYSKRLRALVERTARDIKAELVPVFQTPEAEQALDASLGSQARITSNALITKYRKIFADRANVLAQSMVLRADRDATGKLVRSLRDLSGDQTLTARTLRTGALGDVVKANIAENVQLIKSIGSRYLDSVQQSVMQAITTGNGLQELVPALTRHEGVNIRRARNIANDQVRKVTSTVAKARAQANGLTKYKWVHSGGGKEPRPLHVSYSGRIFSYDDPPVIDERTGERGIPGQAINCRCVQAPVLDFGE